jgi:alanine racemase
MTATCRISLTNLIHNYEAAQNIAGKSTVAAVVKADAYGLGMLPIAQALASQGCNHFFVAYPAEGVTLRQSLPNVHIYVLNDYTLQNSPLFHEYNLTPIINQPVQLALLGEKSYWVQADTGMHRSGMFLEQLIELPYPPLGILSHLACADEPSHPQNKKQLNQFLRICEKYPTAQTSLAASNGLLLGEAYHGQMVRIGAGLYGLVEHAAFLPVVTLSAPVLEVRQIDKGEAVGYGAAWMAKTESLIATVGIGYADGYPRSLSNLGQVLYNGEPLRVVGRVSMDLVTVDATPVRDRIRVGERVILYGEGYTIPQAAKDAGTIGYELLTRLGKRVERQYVN